MLFQYTTVDRIFYEVNKIKPDGFNEIDVIDWIGESLDFIGVTRLYEEAVCYAEVENHQTLVPTYTQNIIQILKDTRYVQLSKIDICDALPARVENEESEGTEEGTDEIDCCNPSIPSCYYLPQGDNYPVIVNQLGEPLTEYELAFYRPYTDKKFDNIVTLDRFQPIRLASNHFYNSIVCENKATPYESCTDEYTIIDGKILRFSFESGGVLISFLKHKIDEKTGYPLIPDNTLIIRAIIAYIRYKFAEDDYYNYRQGSENRFGKAESDWQWYCGQASNAMKMPSSIDEWQNLLEGRNYLIPRQHYYGYFGHFNKNEKRTFFKS